MNHSPTRFDMPDASVNPRREVRETPAIAFLLPVEPVQSRSDLVKMHDDPNSDIRGRFLAPQLRPTIPCRRRGRIDVIEPCHSVILFTRNISTTRR